MRDFFRILLMYVFIILVAYWIDEFFYILERDHNIRNPVPEVDVSRKRPTPMQSVLIDKCPDERGKLQAFVDCHTQITDMMRGEDNVR